VTNEPGAGGKKIFLLYPHSVVHEEMLNVLMMAGFETYTLYDQKRAAKIFELFPDSIVFINIDEGLQEKEWEAYIRGLQQNPKTSAIRIGILSYNQDKELMQKYLMEIAVPCGYVQLKLGIGESTKIIMGALEANEARGRRKHIRAFCEDDPTVTMNFKRNSELFQGKILDISAVGLAVKIPGIKNIIANSVLDNVQLRLRGTLIMTDLLFMGIRSDKKDVCIMLFDSSKLNQDNKLAIHQFIKQTLQRYIDQLKIN
jgi:L-rhamnose mutarotase